MYQRLFSPPQNRSFFLLGPRGTGKTTWLNKNIQTSICVDLLNDDQFQILSARPHRLEELIPKDWNGYVVIDEIQKVPALLNEVHRLMEARKLPFILTGSSARKLRKAGVNLLAGRALSFHFFPLTAEELGNDFDILKSLEYGHLPQVYGEEYPDLYLKSYIQTYLREEVQQEGLTREIGAFNRFLEVASFSQGSLLNVSEIARETNIDRMRIEGYFSILEDLLIGIRLPVFSKKAKRRLVRHKKFYFFDTGVFRSVRPKGPLDVSTELEGIALETLVFQELLAVNHYRRLNYELFFWRTSNGLEVDFVLYGERGLIAIEVKRGDHIQRKHLRSLKKFKEDYPPAKLILVYGGEHIQEIEGVLCVPAEIFLKKLTGYLAPTTIL